MPATDAFQDMDMLFCVCPVIVIPPEGAAGPPAPPAVGVIDGVGVIEGVTDIVTDTVGVTVFVGVKVGVIEGVTEIVGVIVAVDVGVAFRVGVTVTDGVTVGVMVGVGVGEAFTPRTNIPPALPAICPPIKTTFPIIIFQLYFTIYELFIG